MLRASSSLLASSIPVYSRRALPITKSVKWRGNFGAIGRWHGQVGVTEDLAKSGQTIQAADRDVMRYLHATKVRHNQMERSYHQRGRSHRITRREQHMWKRRSHRYLLTAFKAYMQFATKGVLQEQARLVTKFGQAAVNRALGQPQSEAEAIATATATAKRMKAPAPSAPVPRHRVTMGQRFNDRFDNRYRMV